MSNTNETGSNGPEFRAHPTVDFFQQQNTFLRTHLLVGRDGAVKGCDTDVGSLVGQPNSELSIVDGYLVARNKHWQDRMIAMLNDETTAKGRVLATTSPGGTLRVEMRSLIRAGDQSLSTQTKLVMIKNNIFDAQARQVASYFGLSGRETEILEAICAGLRIKEFASQEAIATETARKELKSMLKKLGVGYQVDAVRLVYQTYFEEQTVA